MDVGNRTYILVSGPPGSGKSTLAPKIAAHFGLPLIAKDTIKEMLMAAFPPADVEESRRLGRAAVAVMFAVAGDATRGAVIESVFHRSRALSDIEALPGAVVEVFCRCDPNVASLRYQARSTTRGVGHFDSVRTPDELWNADVAGPVAGGWPVLEADTNQVVDIDAMARQVESAMRDKES